MRFTSDMDSTPACGNQNTGGVNGGGEFITKRLGKVVRFKKDDGLEKTVWKP